MLWSRKITIDAQVYPLPVVQKAVYALADTLSILIQQTGQELELLMSPAISDAALSENAASALLVRTLNDFALREHVVKETSGIRELLARAALMGASG